MHAFLDLRFSDRTAEDLTRRGIRNELYARFAMSAFSTLISRLMKRCSPMDWAFGAVVVGDFKS